MKISENEKGFVDLLNQNIPKIERKNEKEDIMDIKFAFPSDTNEEVATHKDNQDVINDSPIQRKQEVKINPAEKSRESHIVMNTEQRRPENNTGITKADFLAFMTDLSNTIDKRLAIHDNKINQSIDSFNEATDSLKRLIESFGNSSKSYNEINGLLIEFKDVFSSAQKENLEKINDIHNTTVNITKTLEKEIEETNNYIEQHKVSKNSKKQQSEEHIEEKKTKKYVEAEDEDEDDDGGDYLNYDEDETPKKTVKKSGFLSFIFKGK